MRAKGSHSISGNLFPIPKTIEQPYALKVQAHFAIHDFPEIGMHDFGKFDLL